MSAGAQIAATAFSIVVFLLVFEMVRRRRLQERYALIWLAASLVLVLLAAWTQLLDSLANFVGIATPSNAFFVIAFAFLLVLLLHMTSVASRLSDETRVLAQRLALLEQRQRDLDERSRFSPAGGDDDEDEIGARRPRSRTAAGPS